MNDFSPLPDSLITQKKSSILPKILILFVFILILTAGGFLLLIVPKIQSIKVHKQTLSYLPELQTNVDKVGSSLKKMYNIISGQAQTTEPTANKTLLRLNLNNFLGQIKKINKNQGIVAGAETQTKTINIYINNFINDIGFLYKQIDNENAFGVKKRKVLGEDTSLESERTNFLRKIKDVAQTGSNSAKEANKKLNDFSSYLSSIKDTNLKTQKIYTDLVENNQKTNKYLDQATKTTSYYYKISDFQIKLNPFLTSYYNLLSEAAQSKNPELFIDRIDELESTISKLNNEIKSFSISELPQGLEDLHTDNLKVVEILYTNIKDVGQAISDVDFEAFSEYILSLEQQLEPLSTRAVTLEINFWQNNTSLTNDKTLIDNYKNQEKALQELIKKNAIPIFTGV